MHGDFIVSNNKQMFSLKAEPAAIKEVIKMDYFLPLDVRLELFRIEKLKIKGILA